VGLSRFEGTDRLEAEPLHFHQRVRDSFLALAAFDVEHHTVVDASGDPEEIATQVRERLRPMLFRATRHGAPGHVDQEPVRDEPVHHVDHRAYGQTPGGAASPPEPEPLEQEWVDPESVGQNRWSQR
jgi:hypothetical protein